MIINYKTFGSNVEFVDWQNGLDTNISILDMRPVNLHKEETHEVNRFENTTNYNHVKSLNTIGIFVIYTIT